MADRVGQQLGNYRLVSLLGEGGFAEVYLGEHFHLGTQAAIKVLHTQLASDEVERFRIEARTIARLIHPHIVRVLDFGLEGKTPFLVMDYAPHGTLRQRHPKGRRLPLDTIVSHVKQVADALQYAHDEKLIHRDIKPENMLLGRRDEILLSDFGIALVAQSSHYQSTQEMAGTMAYMAPEQLQGKPRRESDQYSLGIVVYEWLSGDRPFHGSLTELVGQHLTVPPPPLQEKVPTVPPAVEQVVLKALEKDPHWRFVSMQAFVAALEWACQPASAHQVALPTEIPLPSEPSLLIDGIAARSPSQPPLPTQVVTPPSQLSLPTEMGTPPSQSFQPPVASMPPHTPDALPSLTREPVLSGRIQLPKQRLSRRAVVAGLAGLAVAGGGLTWLASSQRYQASPASFRSTTPHNPGSLATAASTTTTPLPLTQTILYVGSWFDHSTYALHASDGTVLWHSRGGSHSDEAMALANGIVYCGSDDHTLSALRAGDGSVLWRFQTSGIINSPPRIVQGVVYIGSWDTFLYALHASDGSVLWHFQTGGEIHSSPEVADGVVYFGSGDGYVYALHASDGSVLWRYQTGGAVYAWPAVANGMVYIGSGDHMMYGLQASDGSLRWRYQMGGVIYTTATVDNGIIYTCSGDHYMYGLQADNGNLRQRYQIGQQGAAQPAVSNGIIYACSVDSNVYALHASDGSLIWHYQTAGFMGAKPVVLNGVVYAGGSSGLYALKANDGSLLWKFDGPVTAPVAGS